MNPSTAFHDLDAYIALPRLAGLALSPAGDRLVTSVATLDAKENRYVSALWEVDPAGTRPARRLTRGATGETGAAFAPDGSLLFTSARPDPDATVPDGNGKAALWLLPAGAGEARVLATRPGGIGAVEVAGDAGTVVVTSATMPGAVTAADDEQRRKQRKERKVSAILHDRYPVRFWDHDLGPDLPRLLAGALDPGPLDPGAPKPGALDPGAPKPGALDPGAPKPGAIDPGAPKPGALDPGAADPGDPARLGGRDGTGVDGDRHAGGIGDGRIDLRDLTPDAGRALALDDVEIDISRDGRTVFAVWGLPERGGFRFGVVAIDVATVERTVLLDDADHEYGGPRVSPDGTVLAVRVIRRSMPGTAPDVSLMLLDLCTGATRPLAAGWDLWPGRPVWTPDGRALIVAADEAGGSPLFRIDALTGGIIRLTGDRAAYTDAQVSPDGLYVYALRAALDAPPAPVRLSATATDQAPTILPGPAPAPVLPGTITEVTAPAGDGTPLRAWLALPHGAGAARPAPLLLWIHGGPLGSWNSWSWRWNPWLMVARGYAVLLPDPALSTGYGWKFIQRGWGRWGGQPYTDLMTITDAAVARDDIDAGLTAAMGASFGGYMANWVAGHTDRFRGIVTHAGLWALDQFGPTTDAYHYWRRELTPEMALANSPHRFVAGIRTPMLVVHGDRDYRVPIGDGLRLWAELAERCQDGDGGMPHRFLYFPDENHWVLTPQHAKVWYETVLAFLAMTVHGEPWRTPEILC